MAKVAAITIFACYGLELTSVASLSVGAVHRIAQFSADTLHKPFAGSDPPNLIFVKTPKAASSTTGGVARRIAARHGLGCVNTSHCDWKSEPSVSAHHQERQYFDLYLSLSKPIVWMTSIRDPLSRCLSEFYHFEVGINGARDTVKKQT